MLLYLVRIVYFCICAGAIATYVNPGEKTDHTVGFVDEHSLISFFVLLLLTQIVTVVDVFIPRKRVDMISAVYLGILIGALLSYLLIGAMNPLLEIKALEPYKTGINILTSLMITYFSVSFLLQTKDDFRFVIPYVEFARELKGGKPLIIDSSALIDGRIADVADTRILDSKMLVPEFILKEVQDIADSTDKNRRVRGRRGLDVLSKLQNNPNVEISVYETSANGGGHSVDQRLVVLAKELGGRVVTNDFNLNKVANVQGVAVINLNDVANALKPRYLPGDHLNIKVIKEGESHGQGVGYLDDGTMVVCDQSSHLIGKDIQAVVTSVLQSSAGRMIFAKLDSEN